MYVTSVGTPYGGKYTVFITNKCFVCLKAMLWFRQFMKMSVSLKHWYVFMTSYPCFILSKRAGV